MKFRSSLMALSMAASLVSVQALANERTSPTPISVHSGTINLTGSIVNTPCTIEVSSASQTVNLGQYRADAFSGNGAVSAPVSFDINLLDCAAETYQSVSVTFTGATIDGNSKALQLVTEQASDTTASGVGIQITQDNVPLVVDGSSESKKLNFSEGQNRMRFAAQYVALSETVTPGAANAVADFTLNYQ